MADISNITGRDLSDNERLAELYIEAVKQNYWQNSEAAVHDFWSMAEKALADDRRGTPGKLFAWHLKNKEVGGIKAEHEMRMRKRLQPDFVSELLERAKQGGLVRGAKISRELSQEIDLLGDISVGYLPATLAQCFLPQRPLPTDERFWMIKHRNVALDIEAGALVSDETWERKVCQVPSGFRARLIYAYIVAYAVRNYTKTIDLGTSLRQFIERMGMKWDGRNGKLFTEQIENIAAASMIFAFNHPVTGQRVNRFSNLASAYTFWIERDPRQATIWEPEMELSQDAFDSLQQHNCPINLDHFLRLTRSPRRMDLYTWLAYRTAQIKLGELVKIPLRDLQPIFAPTIKSPRNFKRKLKDDLRMISALHSFRVELKGDMLILRRSDPPIPPKPIITLN